jgi:hypothetical protein
MCPSAKVSGQYRLRNESYSLGKWKTVKALTKVLIEVCKLSTSMFIILCVLYCAMLMCCTVRLDCALVLCYVVLCCIVL